MTTSLAAVSGGGSHPLRGTWTTGGTVEAASLAEPYASQENRYIAFKAVWNATADRAEARIVFDDPVDTPPPVSVTIRKNGRLDVRPLTATETNEVLAVTEGQAWPVGGPIDMNDPIRQQR